MGKGFALVKVSMNGTPFARLVLLDEQ